MLENASLADRYGSVSIRLRATAARNSGPIIGDGATSTMTNIERQILLNQIAILEALIPIGSGGPQGTREMLRQRYRETAELVREQSTNQRG